MASCPCPQRAVQLDSLERRARTGATATPRPSKREEGLEILRLLGDEEEKVGVGKRGDGMGWEAVRCVCVYVHSYVITD